MFSVVIPLYNKQESIRHTLPSVLQQTFTDFEVIIVNDGSTDNSRKVVESFKDDRIRLVDKTNGGVSSARNRGIAEARFDHIAFIDGDDLWNKDFLKTIAGLIRKYPDADVFATAYSCNSSKDVVMYSLGVKEQGIVEDYFETVYRAPIMHASSICITKNGFRKAGTFNEQIAYGEDYDMWDRLGRFCTIAASPEVMASYRVDTENRAMSILPPPTKFWLFHLDRKSITNKAMKKYYSRYVRRAVLRYLTAFKFKWAFQLALRSSSFVSWYSYLLIYEYKSVGVLLRGAKTK